MGNAQARLNVDTTPFVLKAMNPIRNDNAIIAQDGSRAAILEQYTLMAKVASTQKWTPLLAVDPTLTGANMVCGAIGGTLAEFAALTDGEFSIDIDGVTIDIEDLDFTGIDTVLDTPGYMTCGAIGGTLPEFVAVADGQFGIAFDGQAAIQIGPCDFSGIDTIEDTPGYWLCGANGDVIGNWDALTDAAFSYVVDGVAYDTGQMNLTLAVTFDGLINIINFHLNGHATMTYAYTVDKFQLTSNRTGETSSITIGAPAAGTDISAAAWLNQTGGAAVAGTGGENLGQTMTSIINAALQGRGICYMNGDAFVFVSRTAGEVSAVSDLTAGSAGTDISGAGFLNGLAGTNVAGTGGEGLMENIAEIINGAAIGRFFCAFNGDAFVFSSPEFGTDSVVTVLSAVSGGGGTDISGAGFLNGLTGTGTATAGTGGTGVDLPQGIYMGDDIAAATLVAGDVVDLPMLLRGAMFDEDKLVLENSLDLDDVVGAGDPGAKTIRDILIDRNLVPTTTSAINAAENA